MKKLMCFAVAVAFLAVGYSAQAIVMVLENGTNTYSGVDASTGLSDPAYQLTIAYEVTETTGATPYYTYDYTLTTTPGEDLTAFTIGSNTHPIDTLTIGNYTFNDGLAIPAGSGFNSYSVGWDWGFNSGITSDTVGFSSALAPGLGVYTANDDGIDWSSPSLIPAPVPVPEPSTYALLAGAILVFGFVKYRRPAKSQC
jgi:hypothetical protein